MTRRPITFESVAALPAATLNKPDELVFLPLGGAGEIGMNLNMYGYGGKQMKDEDLMAWRVSNVRRRRWLRCDWELRLPLRCQLRTWSIF